MRNKEGRGSLFLLVVFGVLVAVSLLFVFAGLDNAPSGIIITRNASTLYDEGNFSVNWTYSNATGDIPNNYTIFIYANGVLYNKTAKNDSGSFSSTANTHIAGFNFNNHTEANYTFFIQAFNATPVNYTAAGGTSNATRNISIYVDRTVPDVSLNHSYVNGTSKKNTATLTLNISVIDALSGVTGSACIVNINGTNQTISVDSGWCNTTNGNLTGLSDGNRTINVYANDTVGNLKLNNSFVVQIDTTSPSASASCTPSRVHTGETISCSCSGSDATSGVASSSASDTPSTSDTGTYSYDCIVTDNAGNTGTSAFEYIIEQTPTTTGTSSGGSSSTTGFWTRGTYSISEDQFKQGHAMDILAKQRVKIEISNENHYVGVKEITSTTAKVEVSSTPQEKILSIGEEWKVEVTGDNYYDMSLKLNSIVKDKANVFATSIYELIPQEEAPSDTEVVDDTSTITGEATEGGVEEEGNLSWLWILVLVVLVAGVIAWFMFKDKKHKR